MSNREEMIRFTFRMPVNLLNRLKKQAEELNVSTNALILQILWDWADKEILKGKKGGSKNV